MANFCPPWISRVGLLPGDPLLPKLVSLGVNSPPALILSKTLTASDLCLKQSRLLLTTVDKWEELKTAERDSISKKGLEVQAFDRHGREYSMLLRFRQSYKGYHLIRQWSLFLCQNAGMMKAGDIIEVRVFRIPKTYGSTEIGMTLLHYRQEEKQEQQQRLAVLQPTRREETENTEDERTVAEALLLLKYSKGK